MSEERIKERCKREDIALKIVKGFLEKDCYMDTELEYSLNTLLDLYNKQQEEIKALELIHETYKEEMKSIEDRYISKDKIREYYYKICSSVNHFKSENDNNIVLRTKKYLEKLLEE